MPREPGEVDRSLKRWLWNEEQRWKRARHADVGALAVKGWRARDRGPTSGERAAGRALAEVANEGAESVTISPKSARQAREMLGLDWLDAAKLAGIIPSVVIGYETSGRSTILERQRLQRFFEREGLAFTKDCGVAWVE